MALPEASTDRVLKRVPGCTQVVDVGAGTDSASDTRPVQLDHCHALKLDAPVVALHDPRGYRPPIAQNPPEVSSARPAAAVPHPSFKPSH